MSTDITWQIVLYTVVGPIVYKCTIGIKIQKYLESHKNLLLLPVADLVSCCCF